MCYDLNEYDPFEPIVLMEHDGPEYMALSIYSEPMEDYNWEEWLENDDTA